MRVLFSGLNIDDTFHTGKSFGMGANAQTQKFIVYKKISKTQAICIDQFGFGNTREIGIIENFKGGQIVFSC